jgi:hypothetical protein
VNSPTVEIFSISRSVGGFVKLSSKYMKIKYEVEETEKVAKITEIKN